MPETPRRRVPDHRRARMSRRGKLVAAAATVAVAAAGGFGYFALFPQQAPAFVRTTLQTVGIVETGPEAEPPAPTCPLTGQVAPGGKVPGRPALAIKVENHPEARPQAALNDADIVVEEPVEGGYTRFIAIYQCDDAGRVGPVRSGRTTDPDYLRQLGPAVFGYAGGVNVVKEEVPAVGLIDVNYIIAAEAYTRDEARSAPHDLYTSTRALWRAADASSSAPAPLFTYAAAWEGKARKVSTVHLPYSWVSDVVWTWDRGQRAWLRSHGDEPHLLEGDDQVSADSVVIQVVTVTDGDIIDPAGNPSPEVKLTGSGKAYVLRDGMVIVGRWERATLDDLTRFVAKDGSEISLSPGRAWVQLLPSTVEVELVRRG
ncbi:MAG TPA: DUF3048 domain-containing protein [Actinomycetota bacterium]|nr:DUF3048 domain-containing protein [Actinomycetota bacterium]